MKSYRCSACILSHTVAVVKVLAHGMTEALVQQLWTDLVSLNTHSK
jgi:hypothetical protein